MASAGYRLDSWPLLRAGLREQILTLNAVIVEDTVYGKMLEIAGELKGPNGAVLAVRTFWIMETITGLTKFVTLYPDKR